MARMTNLVHSTTQVFSSPMAVFSSRLPVKRDWTHPPVTQAHRFEPAASDYIRLVSTAPQHLHRLGTSLAASWNGIRLSESPRSCTATGRTNVHLVKMSLGKVPTLLGLAPSGLDHISPEAALGVRGA